MQGIPAYSSKISDIDNIELTTPTGAVILKTLGNGFGKMPLMQIENIGYGAGNNDFKNYPNVLRVFISKATKDYVTDTINIIEANIDDLNPLVYGYLMEQLFSKGALDVTLTPTIMKKNRPGIILSVLTEKYYMSEIIDLIFAETTTFGVRTYEVERYKLEREIKEIKTKFGKIKFKIGKLKNKILTISPEYEDCKK